MILRKLFENTDDLLTIDQVRDMILNNANQYLNETNGRLFLSGRNNRNTTWFKGEYRKDRNPLGSLPQFQREFDKALTDHGVTSLRSNSLFISSDLPTASEYGKVYYIFPLGDINYHWYRNSDDLFSTFKFDFRMFEDINLLDIAEYFDISVDYLIRKFLSLNIEGRSRRNLSIFRALLDDNEKLRTEIEKHINDREFWVLDASDKNRILNNIIPEEKRTENFPYDFYINKYFYDYVGVINNQDILTAFREGKEVIINSTNGYLAVDPVMFEIYLYSSIKRKYSDIDVNRPFDAFRTERYISDLLGTIPDITNKVKEAFNISLKKNQDIVLDALFELTKDDLVNKNISRVHHKLIDPSGGFISSVGDRLPEFINDHNMREELNSYITQVIKDNNIINIDITLRYRILDNIPGFKFDKGSEE